MPSVTWDAAFEASPADTDEAKYGAGKIRQLKTAVSERGELEFNWKDGTQPFVKAGKAAVFFTGTTVEINALTGMSAGALAWDTTLKCLKYYSGTAWTRADVIPNASKALFYQDTAPSGWTIQNTLDDKLVYVTKGSAAGGETGGTVHSTGSWTISGFDANVGNHTLTIAEMPAHNHSMASVGGYNNTAIAGYPSPHGTGYSATVYVADQGGGGAHNHPMASHAGTWRPSAYCCIICAKD